LERWGYGDEPAGLARFADTVLEAAVGAVGVVKPQSAFFERHGARGVAILARLVADARSEGLLVVLDVKRGDVGSTNEAYAEAYLGADAPLAADAITVSPYLGLGAMRAMVGRAHDAGALVLVVTRSSNPEGRPIQTAHLEGGLSVEAALLAEISTINSTLAPGGIGPVGAVVGVTHDESGLDLAGAGALFLAPGLGAQGAQVPDVARTFAACPTRVMPSASRSLLEAGPDPARLRDAILSLGAELKEALREPEPPAGGS